jgi:phosphoribosylglycinamide formyltransferase-1
MDRASYGDDGAYSRAVFDAIRGVGVDLVVMAGFLKLLLIPDDFVGRVINIHPALLPKFGGKGMYGQRVHEAVLDAGEPESGCTVHFADNQYDHGETILQQVCAVMAGDTADTLADRVFALELKALPKAITMVLDGAGMRHRGD